MKRDLAVCIILSIVTCGIYLLVWEYNLNKDVSAMCGREPEVDGALFVVLILLTCGIYHIVWNYKMGTMIDESRTQRGETNNSYGVIFLILTLLQVSAIVSAALMQNEVNRTSIA